MKMLSTTKEKTMFSQEVIFEIAELKRKIDSLFEIGDVCDISDNGYRVKIKNDEIEETDFLDVLASNSKKGKRYIPKEIGEQVLVLCPHGDISQGIVIGSIYRSSEVPDSPIIYDDNDVSIKKNGSSLLIGGKVEFSDSVTFKKNVVVKQIIEANEVKGKKVEANGIDTENHTHGYTDDGRPSNTTPPQR